MLNEVDRMVEVAEKAVETIPEVYDDALKPAAQESGKTIALIPRTINAALVPLRKWIPEQEYSLAETEKILAKKLEHVGEEKIVTPNAYVAVPAIQAISYSMDSEELRNLYANLLAKAMNIDTKECVHPAFVELIKQMSPIDAIMIKGIYEKTVTPLIDLCIEYEEGGMNHYRYNISWITILSYDQICVSLNNLERLGLIEIPYGEYYSEDKNYNVIRETTEYKRIEDELRNKYNGKVHENKKYIKHNSLGKSFYEVCIKE